MKTNTQIRGICAALLFINALICIIYICKTDFALLEDDLPIYFFIDLLLAVGFILLGLGIIKIDKKIIQIGSFVAIGGFLLKLIKASIWLFSYISLYNVVYTLGILCELAAFVFFALFTMNNQIKNLKNLIAILLGAGIVLELLYSLLMYKEYNVYAVEVFEFFFSGNYFMTINLCAAVGIIIYLLSGTELLVETSLFQISATKNVVSTNPHVNENTVTNEMEKIDLLLQYKKLLDAGVINQEEYDAKKNELI